MMSAATTATPRHTERGAALAPMGKLSMHAASGCAQPPHAGCEASVTQVPAQHAAPGTLQLAGQHVAQAPVLDAQHAQGHPAGMLRPSSSAEHAGMHATVNADDSVPALAAPAALPVSQSTLQSEESQVQAEVPSTGPRSVREVPFSELHLHEVLGHGAFGKVSRASWQGLEVAVKVLPLEMAQRGDCVHQFRREASTMSSITPHKHVLQLLGACTVGPHLALITGMFPFSLHVFCSCSLVHGRRVFLAHL